MDVDGSFMKTDVLLVDDRQENLLAIEAVLGSSGYNLVKTTSGDEALRYLLDHNPAVILMDVQMPGLDGFETAAIIKSNERTREIPIVFITAINKDQRFVHKGYQHGAVDYIYKPFDGYILKSKVAVFAELRRQHERTARLVAVQRAATTALGESLGVEDAIEKVLTSMCTSLGWDLGTFWKVDRRANVICCQATWHQPDVAAQAFIAWSMRARFAAGVGFPGRIWASGKALWVVDLARDDNFPRFEVEAQTPLRTAVGLPIGVQGETVGVLEFFSHRRQEEDRDLAEIMEAIGSQIGQVLKRTEAVESSRASDASRAAILETALDCIVSIDHHGNIVEFNPAAETTFGYERTNVMGKEMASIMMPSTLRASHRRGMARYLESGESRILNQRIEVKAERADGTQFPAELTIARVPDMDPPLFTAFLRDITQRKRTEENAAFLARASATLAASLDYGETFACLAELVVESLADWCAIDVMDATGQLHPVASAHPDVLKRDALDQVRRKYALDASAQSGAPLVVRTGKSEIYNRVSTDVLVKRDGNLADLALINELGMGSAMIVPLIARTRTLGAMTLVSTDPTHHYTQEDLLVCEELARRAAIAIDNAKLYRDAKDALRARDEFFSIASHELKTPITSLKMLLQIAERGLNAGGARTPSPEKLIKTLRTCNRQVDQLTHLIENLLDIVKIREGKLAFHLEEIDLSELVEELVQRYAAAFAQADCPVDMQIEPKIIGTWDRLRLEQVVVNLMSNAIKYAPGAAIKVALSEKRGNARLVIQDAGPGIPAARHGKIFKRFERGPTERNVTGLGLGLFIVKQVIEAHHGAIRLESQEGSGAAFIIDLPTTPPDDLPARPPPPGPTPPQALRPLG